MLLARTGTVRLAALLGTVVAVLPACSGARPAPAAAGTPVVLVSIDTLRADRLPAYGYRGVETPHLDALRRDAVLFENAYSHCPLTLPSHISMLTGLLPSEHGVRDNIGYSFTDPARPRLSALLKAQGYATGASVAAYVLRGSTGLREGFDFYDEAAAAPRESASGGEIQRPAGEVLKPALAWLETVRDRPFFLFLHVYEPHTPHDPPEPFRTRWGATYEGEIAAADAAVGDLVAALRRGGLYDRALVILASDHGEGLGDHGEEEHGILLYREALRVPLLIKLPRSMRAGTAVTAPAGLLDLVPTITATLGIPTPPALSGRDLLTTGPARPRPVMSETFYPRIHLGWSALRSMMDERYHFIDGPRPELFDVARDPAERTDLFAQQPAVSRAMKAALDQHEMRFAGPARVEPETRERLAALGYLSGAAVPVPSGENLPNPRDHIHVRGQLKEAFALARAGDDGRAVAALKRVLVANPRLFDARVELAASLARLGRYGEALEAYAEAARTSPELVETIALSRARIQLELGRFDAAATEAQAAVRTEPGWAHEVLARVALARGDLAVAEREARLAQTDPAAARSAAVVLAQLKANQGDFAGALQITEGLLAPPGAAAVPNLQFVRGDVLARLGRHAEAEAALREEIRTFPRTTRAYASLAIVRALRGAPLAETRQILEDMHRASPAADTALLAAKTLDFIGDTSGAAAWRRRAAALPAVRTARQPEASS